MPVEVMPEGERLKLELETRKFQADLPLRIAENALKASVEYGKWCVASLFVGNSTLIGAAVAFSRAPDGARSDAIFWFLLGAFTALLSGMIAYINWMIIYYYWRRVAEIKMNVPWGEEASVKGSPKFWIQITFWAALLAGFISFYGTFMGVEALRSHLNSTVG